MPPAFGGIAAGDQKETASGEASLSALRCGKATLYLRIIHLDPCPKCVAVRAFSRVHR